MAEQKYVRIWEIKLARGWVAVTVTVHGPMHDENSTPENLAAVGTILERLGHFLDRLQTWGANNTKDNAATARKKKKQAKATVDAVAAIIQQPTP